ncbi:Hypothetical predicted protein [Olea europaea subsp. europaea]|uniref:Uncharacterized protein n=1 Tax=Olea europaea subsp. europaea TaxID=158383 RepID=A0A8S0PFK1_OLEEU|nr:Hypothetical predicted protein [Olea europaea subsp. europaea]
MTLSTAPPPTDPLPTAAAVSTSNTTAATTRPLLPYPRPPNPHPNIPTPDLIYSSPSRKLPSNPNPNYAQLAPRPPQTEFHPRPQDPSQLLYPIASSGRGFLPRPVTMLAARSASRLPLAFSATDLGQGSSGYVRPSHLPHALLGSGPSSTATRGVVLGAAKGIPVSTSPLLKVGPSSTISDSNGYKKLRDRSMDDTVTVIGDRKVNAHDTVCTSTYHTYT